MLDKTMVPTFYTCTVKVLVADQSTHGGFVIYRTNIEEKRSPEGRQ